MSRDLSTGKAVPAGEEKKAHSLPAFETGGRSSKRQMSYAPGVDGLRAVAVIAVLLYHAGLAWIPGGFLGVEVFFVISGYLITALLVKERRERGRINLKAFWLRRARRLLPALYVVLVATLSYAVIFLPDEVAGLRGDVLAAFGYVTNWYLVAVNESYFEAAGRPSLLKHLWSLAIEEQFYLLWPVVLAIAMTRWRRRYARLAVLVLLAAAAASALLMTVLYQPGLDPSRIYYGTDTRLSGLLIGAALAFAWTTPGATGQHAGAGHARSRGARRPTLPRRRWGWTIPGLLDIVGLVALGGLIWAFLRLDEARPFLYQGGFFVVALTTAVLIFVVVHPQAQLGVGLLGRQPLRWIGLRSYGIYLWHWPVYMITRPDLDLNLNGLPLLALRLAATLALADLSYRYVEVPARSGALGRAWRALRFARGPRRRRLLVGWIGGVGASATLAVMLGVSVMRAEAPPPPSYLASMKPIHTEEQPNATPANEPEARAARPENTAEESQATAEESRAAASPPANARTAPGPVTAIGDSVMLGAIQQLDQAVGGLAVVDSDVGLQAATAVEILQARLVSGQLGEVVIVHLGNNGTITQDQFDGMMQILEGREVIVVNVKVPRTWEGPNNKVLADGALRYPDSVTLVDWYSASRSRPGLFWEDGIHIRPEGAQFYADLISSARLT